MDWPYTNRLAKEDLVVDQFIMGIDNHELNIQVPAHGHRHVEDNLGVALSLEAIHKEDVRACSPSSDWSVKEFSCQMRHVL